MSDVMQHTSDTGFGISLSEAAIRHVIVYLAKQQGSKGVRLSVKKTGCSGLSYVVDYVLSPQDK